MADYTKSIAEINRFTSYDNADSFLKTELGDHFDPHSLNVMDDGTGFTLIVEEGFTSAWVAYNVNEVVRFDMFASIV